MIIIIRLLNYLHAFELMLLLSIHNNITHLIKSIK